MAAPNIPLFSQTIIHDAYGAVLSDVETAMRGKDPYHGNIVPVLGPTRVGKSAIMSTLVDRSDQANSLVPMKNTVWATLPPQTNGKEIYRSILLALGLRTAPKENTATSRERLYRAIESLEIKTIIIDEVHHLIERGSHMPSRMAGDHLKTLADTTRINLVLSGLPRFQSIIDDNEQLRDRAQQTILFKPYDWQIESERASFASAIDTAIGSLEDTNFKIDVDFEDLVRRLYGASGGRIPMVTRLLKSVAVSTEQTRQIGLPDLRQAAKSMQQSGIAISKFFSDEEPDEIELMRSFAGTMSEARLEFNVETLTGLGAAWDTREAS